jgi:hypothetical protein
MGRKGVSKRKKAKVKVAPVLESNSISNLRKTESQPVQVTEKAKASPKDKKKR